MHTCMVKYFKKKRRINFNVRCKQGRKYVRAGAFSTPALRKQGRK